MPGKLLDKHKALLTRIPLFVGLSGEELVKVAGLAERRIFAARETVVAQGDVAKALFMIVRGRLKVVSCGPDGRETVLGIMDAGEVFGEVALIDGGLRSATCVAMEECELLSIERDSFLQLLGTSPTISLKLLFVLAQRLRRLSLRSEDAAFLDVRSRLARSLLDLAVRFGERWRPPSPSVRITIKLSQQELGELVGATRESVNKHLNEWARKGFIEVDNGWLIISDIASFRRLARLTDE